MLLVAAVMLSWVLGYSEPAAAAPGPTVLAQYKPASASALVHFTEGNRLYKDARVTSRALADRVRDLRRAIDEYTAGQKLEDAPAFDYNIAHCARVLGDAATAVAHLQRFLDHAQPSDPQLRGQIEAEITELDPSGEIRSRLRADRAPATEQVPAASADKAVEPSPPRSPPDAAKPVPPLAASSAAEPHASRVWARLGWGLTAAGVVGAGVTTWLAVSARGLDNDAAASGRISERLDLQDRADSRRRAALIVGIGSGAAVAIGLVTLLLPDRADPPAQARAWNLGITGNGLAVIGRF
jgi:hypothetical protein